MVYDTDYQALRDSLTCPICHNEKDQGLIACWTCYRACDMRNGLRASIATILRNADDLMRRLNGSVA